MTSPLLPTYGGVTGQVSVTRFANTGVAGQLAQSAGGVDPIINTFTAAETIYNGLACYTSPSFATVDGVTSDMVVQLPHTSQGVITSDQDITNGATTVVILNGVTMTAITAASDDPATNLAQIASAIAAQPNIASVQTNDNSNTITVTATTGNPVVFTSVTTQLAGDNGQDFTWSIASSTIGQFWGIARYDATKQNAYTPPTSTGVISGEILPTQANQPIAVIQRGTVWVTPETTNSAAASTPVTNASPVYVRVVPTAAHPLVGAFRSDSDSGNAVLVPSSCAQWILGTSGTQGGVAKINITSVQGG